MRYECYIAKNIFIVTSSLSKHISIKKIYYLFNFNVLTEISCLRGLLNGKVHIHKQIMVHLYLTIVVHRNNTFMQSSSQNTVVYYRCNLYYTTGFNNKNNEMLYPY